MNIEIRLIQLQPLLLFSVEIPKFHDLLDFLDRLLLLGFVHEVLDFDEEHNGKDEEYIHYDYYDYGVPHGISIRFFLHKVSEQE